MPDKVEAAIQAALPVGPDPTAIDPGASVWSTFSSITKDGLGPSPASRMAHASPVIVPAPRSSLSENHEPQATEKDLLIAAQQRQIEALERHIARLEAALDKAP